MEALYKFNGEENSFNFQTSLRASEKVNFVHFVENLIVNDGVYEHIIKDLMFDYAIITFFTDVNIGEIFDSENIGLDDVEDIVLGTDIVNIVKENAEEGLISELYKAVGYCVEQHFGIKTNTVSDAIIKFIDNANDKILGKYDIDEVMNMANIISNSVGKVSAKDIWNSYAESDARAWKEDE